MSVLTEEQREYMDAVLRNQPQNGKDNGVAPPQQTAPVVTRARLARPAVDHLLFYDDDDARGDRKLKAVKAKGKKGGPHTTIKPITVGTVACRAIYGGHISAVRPTDRQLLLVNT